LEAQRLESLGLMAAGVTHDFNNLLTCIQGNVGLIRRSLPSGGEGSEYLTDLELAAERAGELCRQLLAYSGPGPRAPGRLDLSAVVAEMTRLLRASLPRGADLRTELAEGLPPIEADATQLRQVVLNLVTNAADALGGRAGVVTARTGLAPGGPTDPPD